MGFSVNQTSSEPTAAAGNQFGTFGGVFTPSILTIFGVIMFLRAGYVVGEAGVGHALIILAVAELIVISTAVSMAAIATNTPVRGGGAYFLISRALGPQFGGAIGTALFLAQALSVPFYLLGFTQALARSVPAAQPYSLHICLAVTVVLFAVNCLGADWAIRTQYFVMTLLALAIATMLVGAAVHFSPQTLADNWEPAYTTRDVSFWILFAVYFPAVTGILAGINMSGDLRDPARSLVRGTFAAIAVGAAVYLAEILLCGGSQARAELIARPFETLLANAPLRTGAVVVAGVFAAALSSAMGSFLGAPRVLQAVARDRIIPGLGPFARGTRRGDEPREALWLTFALSLAVAFAAAGESSLDAFDKVASLVTMLFLATYGMINLAAFVESFGANPSFRPRYRFYHWTLSLAGALASAVIMFLIDAPTALLALALLGGLHLLISRRVYQVTFGDARRGFIYALIRRNLRSLQALAAHPKNWRPTLLVLSGNPAMRAELVRFGAWLGGGRGIVTVADVLIGRLDGQLGRREEALDAIQATLDEQHIEAFPEVLVTSSLDEGIRSLVQAHSLGPVKPNTVLLGWPRAAERVAPYMQHLRDIFRLGKNLVCVLDHEAAARPPSAADRIDVWWESRENGALMLIFAHLMTANWEWRRTTLRLLRVAPSPEAASDARTEMKSIITAGRIECETSVLVTSEPLDQVIAHTSRESRLVMLGFSPVPDAAAAALWQRAGALADQVHALLLIASTGEADLLA
ncbi:MAG: Amino acid permease [Lentisphaerae bacterium ADurb.BinA184]|nr:MAG: Amino acid permease [Lentisphaerae bacterium ADurb.BinA184]